MRNNNQEWRIDQIASTILYRCFGDITITQTKEGVCDFIVTYNDGTDLRFGVVVKRYPLESKEQFNKLINSLEKADFTLDANRLPIIALYVDETTENAKVAFLVGWRFQKPRIYRDFEVRNLTPKSSSICLQIIKSMDSVIRFLSKDDLNVLKKIIFSRKMSDNRIQQAEILYLRKLSVDYRMNEKEVVNERERLERLVKGTPEEEYPQDDLDRLILESVKNQFKDAKVSSKLILFSTDLDDLQVYKNVHCHHTTLLVSPEMNSLTTTQLTMLDGLEMLNVNLDVFVDNIFYQDSFDNVSFDKVEPLEGWLEKLIVWKLMKQTMRPVSDYFR